MPGKSKPPMNYERYILPQDLPEVRPRHQQTDSGPDNPDEAFFIRTHQAFEIWFAQILEELEYARALLSKPAPAYVPESDIPDIEQHVRRATAIFDLVRQHLPLLETLNTTSFYDFRHHLFGASGTQSHRFREIEWLLGLLDDGLLDYLARKRDLESDLAKAGPAARNGEGVSPSERAYDVLARYQARWHEQQSGGPGQLSDDAFAHMPATHAALAARLRDLSDNGSLRAQALNWLARATYPAPDGGRPQAKYGAQFAERFEQAFLAAHAADSGVLRDLQGMAPRDIKRLDQEAQKRAEFFLEAPHRRAIVFLLQFAEQPLLAWPASLVEALLELDQAFANWRDRHIAMVTRVLGGGRISTLGAAGSGLAYLRDTTSKRAFPEITDARTFMLSQAEAADIYSTKQLRPYGFLTETRPTEEN